VGGTVRREDAEKRCGGPDVRGTSDPRSCTYNHVLESAACVGSRVEAARADIDLASGAVVSAGAGGRR